MRPHRQPLDEDSATRLLQGAVHPDDAPPGYAPAAHLLRSAARLPLAPVEEEEAATTVSAMVEAIRGAASAPAPQASRRRPMLGKLLAGKALAAVAIVGFTATGAAAATGSLPDPVQGVVSDAASHVGVNIPHPNHGKSAGHRQDGEQREDRQPEDGGQPAGENPDKGMSQFVEDHKGGEGPLGQVVCVEASGGKCHSGEDNPGQGGDGDTAPPSGGPAENNGKGPKAGDDDAGGDPSPTPPNTGGVETGARNSGKDLPLGTGKPAGD